MAEIDAAKEWGNYPAPSNDSEINYESAASKEEFVSTEHEGFDFTDAMSRFGAVIGLGPLLVAAGIALNAGSEEIYPIVFIGLLSSLFGSLTGFFAGRKLSRSIMNSKGKSPLTFILSVPFFGFLWGAASGAAAGLPLFIFGVFPGAIIGSMIGMVAAILITLFFELFSEDDRLSAGRFYPLAVGFMLTVVGGLFGAAQ